MKFKQLDIKPDGSWLKRTLWSQHAKKSIIYTLLGAIGGLAYFYFSEVKNMVDIPTGDIIKSMLMGSFLGFFITNSPCARGRC